MGTIGSLLTERVVLPLQLMLTFAMTLPGAAHGQDYTKWYLAEGSTGLFDPRVPIANPGDAAVSVTLQYLTADGPGPSDTVTIPGRSSVTLRLREAVPVGVLALTLNASGNVLVEHTGYAGTRSQPLGHSTRAQSRPAVQWVFADLEASVGVEETLTLANPSDADVAVRIDFLGTGGLLGSETVALPQQTVRAVRVPDAIARTQRGPTARRALSAHVVSLSGVPVVASRLGVWRHGGSGGPTGSAASEGQASAGSRWQFAYGNRDGGSDESWVRIANPSESLTTVKTTFHLEDGDTSTDERVVPPRGSARVAVPARVQPWFIEVDGGGTDIVAERGTQPGAMSDTHSVGGAPALATHWGFAEGRQGVHGGLTFDTMFVMANPTTEKVQVLVTFLREGDAPTVGCLEADPRSRLVIRASRYPALEGRAFATLLQTSAPVVVERVTRFGSSRGRGVHAGAGLPLPEPDGTTLARCDQGLR